MKSQKAPTLEDVAQRALQLSTVDKVRLIERLASVLQYDIPPADTTPRRSARGLLADLGPAPSEEDIAEARRDMFAGAARDENR